MSGYSYQIEGIKRRSLAEEAYDYLKEQIISGHIRQGDVITEQKIADLLHISRTPVKRAINRLENENFVTTLNGRGTLVNVLSIADMRDIYSVRITLELLALETAVNNFSPRKLVKNRLTLEKALTDYQRNRERLTVEDMSRLDEQFHNFLIENTSNHYLQKLMPSISQRIQLGQTQAYILTDTFADSTTQHLKIIEALEKKDLPKAKDLLKAHLQWSYKIVLDAMLNQQKRKA